jgi:hypothetical protein
LNPYSRDCRWRHKKVGNCLKQFQRDEALVAADQTALASASRRIGARDDTGAYQSDGAPPLIGVSLTITRPFPASPCASGESVRWKSARSGRYPIEVGFGLAPAQSWP